MLARILPIVVAIAAPAAPIPSPADKYRIQNNVGNCTDHTSDHRLTACTFRTNDKLAAADQMINGAP